MSEETVEVGGVGEVPVWFADGLRLLIFRYPKCNCKSCEFCKETDFLAERWIEKYDS